MRLREAIWADLPRLKREAEHYGKINIQDGTKGGRSGASAPRWIMANKSVPFPPSLFPPGRCGHAT